MITPGLTIDKNTSPDEILAAYAMDNITLTDMKNGWKHYTIRNIPLQGKYFHFTFFFLYNMLNMLSFRFSGQFIESPARDDRSEEAELQRAVDLNNWLDDEIGLERLFSWGTISANYDAKSCQSHIVLTYR